MLELNVNVKLVVRELASAAWVPVSVVGEFHLIGFQLRQQQHQNFDEYEENDLHKHINGTFKRIALDWSVRWPITSNITGKTPLLAKEIVNIKYACDYSCITTLSHDSPL